MGVSVDTGGGGGGRKSVDVDINLVPFIDMMSCLVAFLLITAVWTNVAQVKVNPKGVTKNTDAPPPTEDQPPNISVLISQDSVWVGYGTVTGGPVDTRQLKKKADGYDMEALGVVLMDYKRGEFATRRDIEIAAEDKVTYEDIIDAMDVTVGVGFDDVGFIEPGSLTLRFKQ